MQARKNVAPKVPRFSLALMESACKVSLLPNAA
jgi:hypothetical protein